LTKHYLLKHNIVTSKHLHNNFVRTTKLQEEKDATKAFQFIFRVKHSVINDCSY